VAGRIGLRVDGAAGEPAASEVRDQAAAAQLDGMF
jgi:hypothetical protein